MWREIAGSEYRRGRTLGSDEGGGQMVFLVMLVIAVAVVVLVMRAASASDGGPGAPGRSARRARPQRPSRPLAPDDDPDFLRELERRTRRDDGSPA